VKKIFTGIKNVEGQFYRD